MAGKKSVVKGARLSGAVVNYLGFNDDPKWQWRLRALCENCLSSYDKDVYARYQAAVKGRMDFLRTSGYDAYIRLSPDQFAQLTALCERLDADFGTVSQHRLSRALDWLCCLAANDDHSGTRTQETPKEPVAAAAEGPQGPAETPEGPQGPAETPDGAPTASLAHAG